MLATVEREEKQSKAEQSRAEQGRQGRAGGAGQIKAADLPTWYRRGWVRCGGVE